MTRYVVWLLDKMGMCCFIISIIPGLIIYGIFILIIELFLFVVNPEWNQPQKHNPELDRLMSSDKFDPC